ncbi:hypothetical protein QMK19_38895 [Streptomyces sp. H10-C2]|uniref:hypothetical protein n=1 Tax=unclassified Streptomyces TaxID=2593676 RepID=UPI0024B9646F|nr:MULTISPECIES: hypothetical protein [unclassified Streptomyces]MDJ0347144.1 hypothetical protein [Streptomyces sp. PH10-H1]MDJ0375403.1 hypothetical protein [Streptomyces sp. H10-C2]
MIPPQPGYAPDMPAPAPAPVAGVQEPEQPSVPERPQAVPGGPLLLTLANAAGLVSTSAYYAAGVAGVVAVGGAAGVAGATATAYAFRKATRGARRGFGSFGGLGGRGGLRRAGFRQQPYGTNTPASRRRTNASGAGGGGGTSTGGSRNRRRRSGDSTGPLPGAGGTLPRTRQGGRHADTSGGKGTGTGPGSRADRRAPGGGTAPRGAGGKGSAGRSLGRGLLGRLMNRPGRGGGGGGGRSGGPAAQTTAAARRRAGQANQPPSPRSVRGLIQRAGGGVGRAVRAARTGWPAMVGRTGSALARGWRSSTSARRSLRARLRYARRITGTLVLASIAGILGKMARPFTWGSGKAAALRAWNWRANRARPKEDALRAREAAATAAEKRAPVRATVDDPGNTSAPQGGAPATGAPGQEGTTVQQVFARAAEAVATAYSAYSPPSMLAVAAEYQGLPEGIRAAATAIRHLALNTEQVYPAHKAVVEAVSGVYKRLAEAADKADEVHTTFTQVHAADLARHTEPRNGWSGEVMWNIGGRPGDSGTAHQSVFSRSCDAVATVYATYQPGVMTEVSAEYECLPTGIEHLASAVQSLAVHSADSYAVEPVVAELVAAVHQHLLHAVSAASDVLPVFRRVHAADLARHEAPRNGPAAEAMWNV